MNLIIILIAAVYTILVSAFIIGFLKTKEFQLKNLPANNSFLILIPFRNEAENLPALLRSIALLNYPKELFEILLINDDSNDNYDSIIDTFIVKNEQLSLRVLDNIRQSNSPKKDAIKTGIEHSKYNWILTTDADCMVPNLWLRAYDEFIQRNNVVLISGPVTFNTRQSFLNKFQLLDFSALIGSTIGGFGIQRPFLCNGANLCYSKNVFNTVDGYSGNNTIASGDDIFLLEKIVAKYPKQINYLKSFEALVQTTTMNSLKELFSQRIRWASKSRSYQNRFAQFVGIVILLMNILFCSVIVSGIFYSLSKFMITIISVKITVDFILIALTLKFKRKPSLLVYYPIVSIIHPFFNIIVGCMALFKQKYTWKDRTFLK
jgi:cellulose synthase/poly-beta-1,6-N-acetylglucosamine synthase-like glycosyltransferase